MHLQFDFPPNLNAEKFIKHLGEKANIELSSRKYVLKTYYDSFDWRLFNAGLLCEFSRTQNSSSVALKELNNDQLITNESIKDVPNFVHQFSSDEFRSQLQPILDIRALIPQCNLDYENFHINVLNKERKTILRLVIEEHQLIITRITLQPIKGYDKSILNIISILTKQLALTVATKPILVIALKLQGRRPNDYSSKLNITLDPYMRADIATKLLYSRLLKTIKANEQGTIANTDSEFLHDFRVAIRRTRSGISQLKGLIPDTTKAYFADFFSWLGQITSDTRDLDVYLLNFTPYKNSLPESIRDDLNPLYDFLLNKQHSAQLELAKHLRSNHYISKISEWESFLKEQTTTVTIEANAKLSIYELATQRLLKSYKKVLKQGNAIKDHSVSEALHDLRKSCKKLRYLLEFFVSLYPEAEIKVFIKNLKDLQEVLGDFQDYAVQEHALKVFSVEMLNSNGNANTLLAIGVLIQNLEKLRNTARYDFAEKFQNFKHEDNQRDFEALLSKKIRPTRFNISS